MSALEEARLHLAKAREFLDAAETSRDLGLDNAAASNAVISAINSKDATASPSPATPARATITPKLSTS